MNTAPARSLLRNIGIGLVSVALTVALMGTAFSLTYRTPAPTAAVSGETI